MNVVKSRINLGDITISLRMRHYVVEKAAPLAHIEASYQRCTGPQLVSIAPR